MSRALNWCHVDRGWSMELGSTLEWFAPDDDCTSSLKLFDSIDQWRSLFERSTLGVAKLDAEFDFLIANPAFLTMFGYSSEELQQLSFLDICIDEARDECRVPLRELREGVRLQYEIETQHRRPSGQRPRPLRGRHRLLRVLVGDNSW